MADTTFTDGVTPIVADWLNDVNTQAYDYTISAGDWTPVLTDLTNDATMNAQVGKYTRIGKMVLINGYLSTTNLGSVSGNLKISGLPFVSSSIAATHGSISVGWGNLLNITAGENVSGYVSPSTSYIHLALWDGTLGSSFLQHTEWTNTGLLIFHGVYWVD